MAPHRMPARQVSSCCGDSFAVVRRAVPSAEVGDVLARPRGRRIEAKRMLSRPCAGGSPQQTPGRRRTLSTRQGRRFFRSTACGGAEQRGIESKRTITRRIHSSAVAAAGRRAVDDIQTAPRVVGAAGRQFVERRRIGLPLSATGCGGSADAAHARAAAGSGSDRTGNSRPGSARGQARPAQDAASSDIAERASIRSARALSAWFIRWKPSSVNRRLPRPRSEASSPSTCSD